MKRRQHFPPRPRDERGIVLVLSLMLMTMLSLLGVIFLTTSVTESNIAKNDALNAQALYVAEAGAYRAYAYLTGTAPDNTTNASWRTTGLTECMGTAPTPPCPAGVASYSIVVADGAGGTIVVTASATMSSTTYTGTRKIQLTLTGPTNMGTNGVTTGGTVGNNGIINGNVAAASVSGTTVNGTVGPAAPLPSVNTNTLKAKAQAQGYYFVGATTSSISGGVVRLSDSYGHTANLPQTFTTTGNDNTGTVNVIYIDNSCSTCNDGTFSLSGNYTLGGYLIAMGAASNLTDAFGGNFVVNGIIFTPGSVTQNGGGNATNTTGSVYAALGITLNGNHTTITFDNTKVSRAGALGVSTKNWTELPPS